LTVLHEVRVRATIRSHDRDTESSGFERLQVGLGLVENVRTKRCQGDIEIDSTPDVLHPVDPRRYPHLVLRELEPSTVGPADQVEADFGVALKETRNRFGGLVPVHHVGRRTHPPYGDAFSLWALPLKHPLWDVVRNDVHVVVPLAHDI